jgi:hypothetical protein
LKTPEPDVPPTAVLVDEPPLEVEPPVVPLLVPLPVDVVPPAVAEAAPAELPTTKAPREVFDDRVLL